LQDAKALHHFLQLSRERLGGEPEGMKAPDSVAILEQHVIAYCEQRALQSRKDRKLVIRILDRGERRGPDLRS
jgi:hypothetical protein